MMGDQTDGTLIVAAAKAGFERTELEEHYSCRSKVLFTSERRRMTTVNWIPEEEQRAFLMGLKE